jgi:hypothetical protein
MSVLDFALSLAGVPEATIEDLDKQLPGLARIAAGAREALPLMNEAKPHLDALAPIFVKLWPILQKISPDIEAATPVAQEIIGFVASKE